MIDWTEILSNLPTTVAAVLLILLYRRERDCNQERAQLTAVLLELAALLKSEQEKHDETADGT
jgi:hypothetical protein